MPGHDAVVVGGSAAGIVGCGANLPCDAQTPEVTRHAMQLESAGR